jgi:prepilin-type processing-associated H-X9-DG protein
MIISMNHGSRIPGDKLTSYRFNAVFFDGHAETLTAQQGMNPALWIPSGSILPSSECTPECIQLYFNGKTSLLMP